MRFLKWMLPLLLAATPAWAEDNPTNTVPAKFTVTTGAPSPHLESSSKLDHTPDTAVPKAKQHWWTRFKSLFKGGPSGNQDEIIQYEGMSSRPWGAISADPPYMSNWQDCRVHHPNFGMSGSY